MSQPLSASQLRAARGLLNWSRPDLARESGVSEPTLHRFENNMGEPELRTQQKLRRVFESKGVDFLENSGVRIRPEGVEVLNGYEGFVQFFDRVHVYVRHYGGLICVSGVDEKLFVKHQGDFADPYMKGMAEVARTRTDFKMLILIEEGDYNFVASAYAKYRWQLKEHFNATPFYVFGDNLALISFNTNPAPKVMIIRSPVFAEAYRVQFKSMWAAAREPAKKR